MTRRLPLIATALARVSSVLMLTGCVGARGVATVRLAGSDRRSSARRTLLGLALVVCCPALGLAQTTTLVEYYHTDVLGSVRVVTNAQGQVLARHDFTPFGEELHPPSPPMDRKLFTGQEHDLEMGQDYFHARQMMAEIARFGAFDPLSTTPSARGNAQDFNGYAYARNNPLRFKDPTGLAYWEVPLFDFPWAFLPRGGTFGTHTTASSPASAYLSDNPPSDWSADWLAAIGGGGPQVDPNRPDFSLVQLACGINQRAGGLTQVSTYAEFYGLSLAGGGAGAALEVGWAALAGRGAVGATGWIGEFGLQRLGGASQTFFRTSLGARFVDQLVNGVAHEAKVGYQALTAGNALQLAKDAELLASGNVSGVVWHFFTSPVTGAQGPSGPLLEALLWNGINVIIR